MSTGNRIALVPLWLRFELIRLVQCGKAGEDYTIPAYLRRNRKTLRMKRTRLRRNKIKRRYNPKGDNMKTLTRLLLVVSLMMLLIAPAQGASQNVTLNWSNPTTCVGGAAIGTADCPALTGTNVYCGSASGAYGAPTSLGVVQTYTWSVSTSQTLYCSVTASNSAGESGKSNEGVKTVVITNPPSGVTGCSFAP